VRLELIATTNRATICKTHVFRLYSHLCIYVSIELPIYNSEIHSEAVIERVWRCTWRPRSSELRAALGGRGRVNSEMHLEAGIERVWRCTWRLRSTELRDAHGGRDRASLEMQLETEIE
jgi:hypothetical protein